MRVWVCLLAVSVCIKGYADPESVKTAMFRLDASNRASLTLGEAGVVEGWTSLAGEKPVTSRPMGAKPVFRTDDRERPFVDFGGMNSRRDLAYPRLTGIRTVFAVWRFDASRFCHLLCDGTAYHFHRGDEGAYGSEEWSKFGRIWNGTLPVEDPFSDPLPDDGVQLVCAEMREGCASDRLTTDRAFPDRNGGRHLYELLVFDRTLSDADRLALTRHLFLKKQHNLMVWLHFLLQHGIALLQGLVVSDERFCINRVVLTDDHINKTTAFFTASCNKNLVGRRYHDKRDESDVLGDASIGLLSTSYHLLLSNFQPAMDVLDCAVFVFVDAL